MLLLKSCLTVSVPGDHIWPGDGMVWIVKNCLQAMEKMSCWTGSEDQKALYTSLLIAWKPFRGRMVCEDTHRSIQASRRLRVLAPSAQEGTFSIWGVCIALVARFGAGASNLPIATEEEKQFGVAFLVVVGGPTERCLQPSGSTELVSRIGRFAFTEPTQRLSFYPSAAPDSCVVGVCVLIAMLACSCVRTMRRSKRRSRRAGSRQ